MTTRTITISEGLYRVLEEIAETPEDQVGGCLYNWARCRLCLGDSEDYAHSLAPQDHHKDCPLVEVQRLVTEESASVPEPPPIRGGDLVTPPLLKWLEDRGMTEAADLVRARDAFGRAKYGQGLTTADGRDHVEDAAQEIGDFLQYLYSAQMQGLDATRLGELMNAAVSLMMDSGVRR